MEMPLEGVGTWVEAVIDEIDIGDGDDHSDATTRQYLIGGGRDDGNRGCGGESPGDDGESEDEGSCPHEPFHICSYGTIGE